MLLVIWSIHRQIFSNFQIVGKKFWCFFWLFQWAGTGLLPWIMMLFYFCDVTYSYDVTSVSGYRLTLRTARLIRRFPDWPPPGAAVILNGLLAAGVAAAPPAPLALQQNQRGKNRQINARLYSTLTCFRPPRVLTQLLCIYILLAMGQSSSY